MFSFFFYGCVCAYAVCVLLVRWYMWEACAFGEAYTTKINVIEITKRVRSSKTKILRMKHLHPPKEARSDTLCVRVLSSFFFFVRDRGGIRR